MSFISEMELLSWRGLTPNQYDWLSKFMNQLQIYEIDRETKLKAIELRRENQIKLPDAIIAATAITKNAMLLTNDADYLKIAGLKCRQLKLLSD